MSSDMKKKVTFAFCAIIIFIGAYRLGQITVMPNKAMNELSHTIQEKNGESLPGNALQNGRMQSPTDQQNLYEKAPRSDNQMDETKGENTNKSQTNNKKERKTKQSKLDDGSNTNETNE